MHDLKVLGRTQLSTRTAGEGPRRPVSLQPKRFALLTYLAVARPRGFQRRDTLLVLFWPESDARRARNALNQAVFSLRSTLGSEVLPSRGRGELGVARSRLACDAVSFDEAFAADRYPQALDCYRGELLTGFHVRGAPGFERWLDSERARLRRQAKTAASILADREEGAGNPLRAVRRLERALEIGPLDEKILRRLIKLLDRMGDRTSAFQAFDRFVVNLRSTVGGEPSAETRQLISELRGRGSSPSYEDTAGRSSVSRAPAVRSLAVLPLRALRPEPEQEVFVEGLTEALIAELAGLESVRVISRQSVLRFEDSDRPLWEIGDILGVDAVIEGSLLRVKDRLRLSLQLLRVEPEEHLWAQVFKRELGQAMGLLRDVALAVRKGVEEVVAPQRSLRPDRASVLRETAPQAYEEFLQGVALASRGKPEDLDAAVAHFRSAVEIDPGFGEPLAWTALIYANMLAGGILSPAEARDPMEEAAEHAFKLEGDRSAAWFAQAVMLQFFDRDWEAAKQAYQNASAAGGGKTGQPWTDWQAMYLIGLAEFEEGLPLAREASRNDPIGPTSFLLGWGLHKARRFEDSIEQLKWTEEVWPGYPFTRPFLAASCLFAGARDTAIEIARSAVSLTPTVQLPVAYGAATLGRGGLEGEARRLLGGLKELPPDAYVDPYNLAVAYAGLRDDARALEALERLADNGSPQSWAIPSEPFFDPLRDDPRFEDVVDRLGLPRLELEVETS